MKTKNKTAISTLIAVTVAFSILVAFSATASATTTWYVDDSGSNSKDGTSWADAWHDISYAISHTSVLDGDTIMVGDGTYTENVAVNKQVTLLGANHDVDPAGLSDRGGESVIVWPVTIKADDVTVNGFKLTSSSYIEISDASHSALNVNVSYNILENTNWADGAIDLNGGNRCAGGYIGYNTISGASGYGIQTIQNNDVTIEYNHVLNSLGFAAIDAGYHDGTGIVIHANTITNSGGKGINYWAEDGGVITDNVISNSNFEAIYTDAQATISGNQISGGNMYGILVMPWTSGTAAGSTVSSNTISNTLYEGIQSDVPVTITYNDISGGYSGIQLSNAASGSVIDGNNIHDNDGFGLSILDSVTDVIVKNNQLSYNPWCGVIVWGDGEGSGIHINFNEITGNGFGVYSPRTTSDVDAEYNWWGDTSGPYHATTNSGGIGDSVSDYVDYEPWIGRCGMVTGGGWIISPVGAYAADTSLSGKATFGFVSMYKKGATVPTGNTQFNFQVADLNFHSDSYDWLVIAGHKAMYKGTGTIKGYDGDYGFMLSAIDEKLTPSTGVDMFRIKIWDKTTDGVIYDNNMGSDPYGEPTTAIAGGQIVIHKTKEK